MAHFAELDPKGYVIRVIVVSNDDCLDENGNESEAAGIAFCKSLFGDNTIWVQTSYNDSIRKRYAGVGYTYDASLDAFLTPQSYPSWVLEDATWVAPKPYPDDGKKYFWDEDSLSWKLDTLDLQ